MDTDYRFRTKDERLWIMDYLRITDYELWITYKNYRLWITDFGLHIKITDYVNDLRSTDFLLRITNYGLRISEKWIEKKSIYFSSLKLSVMCAHMKLNCNVKIHIYKIYKKNLHRFKFKIKIKWKEGLLTQVSQESICSFYLPDPNWKGHWTTCRVSSNLISPIQIPMNRWFKFKPAVSAR